MPEPRTPVAIVLSGGGAQGDFQVGALKYLYEQKKIQPQIICGCSVGSINGIKLAEGKGGLEGLEKIWRDLRTNGDMYEEESWLQNLNPSIKEQLFGPKYEVATGSTALLPSHTIVARVAGDIMDVIVGPIAYPVLKNAIEEFNKAGALYNLNPIKRRLEVLLDLNAVYAWGAAGNKLRLGTVSLETGHLRYVTEAGLLLERDNKTQVPTPAQTIEIIHEECLSVMNIIDNLKGVVSDLQNQLNSAAPQEKPDIIAQINELSTQIENNERELERLMQLYPPRQVVRNLSFIDGVLASASIPGYFPTVKLGDEYYVDGGVRDILPIQAAVDLGAKTIYAIVASKAGLERSDSFESMNLLKIVERAVTQITFDEVMINETKPQIDWDKRDVYVIQPTVPIHDILTIDPGLIDLSIDYGYMRAADVVAGPGQNSEQSRTADSITELRYNIWRLECYLHHRNVPGVSEHTYALRSRWIQWLKDKYNVSVLLGDVSDLHAIRKMKRDVNAYVKRRRRLGGVIPPDAKSWWLEWERHPWAPTSPTPWDRFETPRGTIEAETPPEDQPAHRSDLSWLSILLLDQPAHRSESSWLSILLLDDV